MYFWYLQNKLSIQFDDLLKKAWEEDDVAESKEDGIICTFYILALGTNVCKVTDSWAKSCKQAQYSELFQAYSGSQKSSQGGIGLIIWWAEAWICLPQLN